MTSQAHKKTFHVSAWGKSPVNCTHGMLVYKKDICAFCKERFTAEQANELRIANARRNNA